MKHCIKNQFAVVMGWILLMVTVAGCSKGQTAETQCSKADVSSGQSSGIDISGTTIRYSNTYAQDEKTVDMINRIIKRYEEQSGVTVINESFDNNNYRTWITTQHAANSSPDIIQMNYNWAWEDYAKGYVIDLEEYLNQPNPYDQGKALMETLSPMLMDQAKNPDSGIYSVVPSHVAGVKIIYNKEMFSDGGINDIPFTLNEFFDACEKLAAKGYVPFAFANAKVNDAHMNWWMHNFISQMDSDLRAQMDLDGDGFVEKNELVAAADKGLIDFTRSPFKEGFEMLRQFSRYWNSDFNSTDRSTSIEMFVTKRAAMTCLLSGEKNMVDNYEGLDIDYGIMMMPALTDENYPGATGNPLNNGGRIVDGFAIANSGDPVKQAAAIDFMRYMLSPEPLTILMAEKSALPPLKDMPLSNETKGWLTNEKESILYANYFGYATSKEFTDFQVLSSQIFLTDPAMAVETYGEELNKEWRNMVEAVKIENNWSAENEYGRKR